MKQTLCILDVEPDYANQFMEVINARKSCPFMVHAFTSVDTLMSYLKDERADVILISPELYEKRIANMTPASFFLLMDGRERIIPEDVPMIRKYQKADEIIRAVLKNYDISTKFYVGDESRTELIGVYSPLHRIGKTSFAIALAQELGKAKKVLYLNLESCSGFSGILGRDYDTDLTDLIYYSRQQPRMMLSQIAALTHNFYNIDYIPPAKVPIELMDINADEWSQLFDTLTQCGLYDYVMVDFGEGIQGILGLLSRCGKIFTPVQDDVFSESKMNQYQDMLELLDYTEIISSSRNILMPKNGVQAFDNNLSGDLFWGAYAGFAKQIAAEEYACIL